MDMAFGGGFGEGAGLAMGAQGGGPNQPLQEVERVRSDFPETWLWSNATVGYGVLCSRRVQRSLIVCIGVGCYRHNLLAIATAVLYRLPYLCH